MKMDASFAAWPIELSYVIPCYFNEGGCEALHSLLMKYAEYASDILDRVEFIIVDDGSPIPVSLPDVQLNMRLLRIEKDISWNQCGARNLGAVMSRSERILMVDLDHFLPEESFRYLLKRNFSSKRIWRFRRTDFEGGSYAPAPNIFTMSRSRFLGLFGYDEEFAGHYGYEDGMFFRWQRYNGTRHGLLPRDCPIYVRKIDPSEYHSLSRDKSHNANLRDRKKAEWSRWGQRGGHSRHFLSFDWKLVQDRSRPPGEWSPPEDRLWKITWWLRQFWGSAIR